VRFEEIYYEEMTDQSFKEMLNICNWLNDVYGHHPVIIGGWAVYLHNPSLGSRDIDILFPDRRLKHMVVEIYLASHDYRSEGLFGKEYFKEIKTSRGTEKIIIDACSVEDVNRVKGTDLVIPWELAYEYQKKVTIEGVKLYIPRVEVLLLYKVKAAFDRTHDMSSTFDPFYLQHKILKDYLDVVNLITYCEMDFALLRRLLNVHGFLEHFIAVCNKMENSKEVMEKYSNWIAVKDEFIAKLIIPPTASPRPRA